MRESNSVGSLRPGQAFNPFRQFNGAYVPEEILRMAGLSEGAKLLYGQLCRYAGRDGNAYPSYRKLAEDMASQPRKIMRLAKELSGYRLVEVRKRTDERGRQRSNAFVFIWHEAFYPKAPDVRLDGEIVNPEDGESVTGEGDKFGTPEGVNSDTPLRESQEESQKEEQQQVDLGVTGSGNKSQPAPAAAQGDGFRKTLQSLRARGYPDTRPGASWEQEARASGFTDEQLSETIDAPGFDAGRVRAPDPLVWRARDILRRQADAGTSTLSGPTFIAVRVAETLAQNGMDEGRERLQRYAKCGDKAIETAAQAALQRVSRQVLSGLAVAA